MEMPSALSSSFMSLLMEENSVDQEDVRDELEKRTEMFLVNGYLKNLDPTLDFSRPSFRAKFRLLSFHRKMCMYISGRGISAKRCLGRMAMDFNECH